MKRAFLLTALLALTACTPSTPVAEPDTPDPASVTQGLEGPPSTPVAQSVTPPAINTAPIEVCFVLDTTGSMGGLIDGAKQKIWSIANQIIKDNPRRPLKIALVPYRDRGDEYVTRVFDLTDDLDDMYTQLMSFTATGGGDEPESVNQALQDAVENVNWSPIISTAQGPDATRILFLVGDAPPHMDYPDDVKWPITLQKAVKMNIIVNTIQCGTNAATTPIWQDIARAGEGSYFNISQSGNMIAISTPLDARIVELNKELATTVVPYGSAVVQEAVAAKTAAPASMRPEAAADRSSYNLATGGKAVQGRGDLVQDLKEDKEILKALKTEDLPAVMKKMTAAERTKYLESQSAKRQRLNAELSRLTGDRAEWLKQENARRAGTDGDSFDQKVSETIREQSNREPKK